VLRCLSLAWFCQSKYALSLARQLIVLSRLAGKKKARHEALQLNAFDPFSVLGRRLRMNAPGPTSSQDN